MPAPFKKILKTSGCTWFCPVARDTCSCACADNAHTAIMTSARSNQRVLKVILIFPLKNYLAPIRASSDFRVFDREAKSRARGIDTVAGKGDRATGAVESTYAPIAIRVDRTSDSEAPVVNVRGIGRVK